MKRLVATVLLLILIGTFLLAYRGQSTEEHTGFTAHAMGAVDGLAYTNAHEAFVENYKKRQPCIRGRPDVYFGWTSGGAS